MAIAPTPVGAGADRDAYAALATERPGGKKRRSSRALKSGGERSRVPSEAQPDRSAPGKSSSEPRKHSPGEEPLPEDPAEFVEEVHSRIDLIEKWTELLKSEDEKIKQRAVEKLTEMRYKGVQTLAEEPQRVVFELTPPKHEP